jgi:hypothetical protein
MSKSDPEAQRKSSLSDCTWLEKWAWIFYLETLKFLMHFREPGRTLYFIFTHTHIFLTFYHIYLFIYLFICLYSFFICPLWTLKLHCIVPTSSPMLRRLLVLGQRGDRNKVGTRNTFPLERYLKSSILAPSCNLPWIYDPFSTIGWGQGGNHKRWFLVLRLDIRRGLWDLRCGDTQCMDKRIEIR